MKDVFITGGTGYMGVRVAARLVARGHRVRALARAASAGRLPAGVEPVIGDALVGATYGAAIAPADAFVHLVGTPHPNPSKTAEFERVDLASAPAAITAASAAGVRHFVYLSVAQPAPVMHAYIAARAAAETRPARAGWTRPSCGRGTCSARAIASHTCSRRSTGSPSACR